MSSFWSTLVNAVWIAFMIEFIFVYYKHIPDVTSQGRDSKGRTVTKRRTFFQQIKVYFFGFMILTVVSYLLEPFIMGFLDDIGIGLNIVFIVLFSSITLLFVWRKYKASKMKLM